MDKKEIVSYEFHEILQIAVEGYKGKHSNIITLAPTIYKTMCNLLDSIEIRQIYRNELFVAIGYFVIPKDLFSEATFGPIGYIDDIMLSIHVLKKIKGEYGIEEIFEYWDDSYDILEKLLSTDFLRIKDEYSVLLNSVLKFCGI